MAAALDRRASPKKALALIVAAAALLTFPLTARAAEPGIVSDLNWGISTADQDRAAAAISDLGARWTKLHVRWKNFEPSAPGSYNSWWLDHTDRAVRLALDAGSRVFLMIYDAPSWASGSSSRNTPTDPADFANFVGFLADRYRGQVDAYEIWNEQNTSRFWSSGPSPSGYTGLLKAAYSAIKTADANAKVVFGGLSTNDYRFVEGAYAAGAKGLFDVMALHPYTYCGSSSPAQIRYGSDGRITRDSFPGYREVRASMLAAGDSKPIWLTEFGWTTTSKPCDPGSGVWQGGVSEETQADYLTKALALAQKDSYVQVATWYSARNTYSSSDADTPEARFGLMRTDFSPKPAYAAFRAFATGAPAPKPVSSSPPPANAAPTVTLTSPVAGALFNASLAMAATATDDKGVVKVEFWFDGRRLAADTSPPFSYTWKVPTKTSWGSHSVAAYAYDVEGLTATSGVTVTRSRSVR